MSNISKERKEALLKKYGNRLTNAQSGPGLMGPGGPAGPGGFAGPKGNGPGGRGPMVKGRKPENTAAEIKRLLSYIGRG
jgi:hypothetical protein